MRIDRPALITSFVATLLTASWLHAELQIPQLGQAAPKLTDLVWIQGEPIKEFNRDHIYVIEFWATWCPPCRQSIPHLNELHKRFERQKVVIVGISTEEPELVRRFVRQMGETMTYRVACDPKRINSRAYMDAYDQHGIPCAFVIDQRGRVAWIGHPMGGLDQVLEQLIKGTYDLQKAQKEFAATTLMTRYLETALQEGGVTARPIAEKILELIANDAELLADFAFQASVSVPISKRDLAIAEKAITQAVKRASDSQRPWVEAVRGVILFEQGKRKEGYQVEQQALKLAEQAGVAESVRSRIQRFLRIMERQLQSSGIKR